MSIILLVLSIALPILAQQSVPEYVKQCKLSDPKLEGCLKDALHHLKPYLVKGIPEIQLPSVEPFIIDSLSLALTGGEKGYKITLKDIHLFGASSFTVLRLKLGENGKPFETKVHIPVLKINANYTSSGVLIVLPASGGGIFDATFGDVTVDIKGYVSTAAKSGKDYLHVDKLDINLIIKNIKMHVSKAFNNNRILTEATNLFLKENGREVLNVMMPQLKTKMATIIKKTVNKLLEHTPLQTMVKP